MTQRVVSENKYSERRDALDQRWYDFLAEADLCGVALPNCTNQALNLFNKLPFVGLVLTGGNSPIEYGGDSPERDRTEMELIKLAIEMGKPVIGVCRGMQIIQLFHNGSLVEIKGHVSSKKNISYYGKKRIVNSYHELAIIEPPDDFEVFAVAEDNVVKGYKHDNLYGIMWHPERMPCFDIEDIDMFREVFS